MQFRQALSGSRSRHGELDSAAARAEFAEYCEKDYPIFVAEGDDSQVVGYLLCRVDGSVVWAESLFVKPEHRRRGIASRLYEEAERFVESVGGQTVFNWVHPNNTAAISFLRRRGYNVLNLIELRCPVRGEDLDGTILVGGEEFVY
jgi:ribosomal protein S18 acetylase RimI-like enzyme